MYDPKNSDSASPERDNTERSLYNGDLLNT